MAYNHQPVLYSETLSALAPRPGGRYLDGTLGRAGHTRGILAAGGEVLGIDRDDAAIAAVTALGLKGLTVAKGCHGDLSGISKEHGFDEVDGILLDLGVSSPQLDEAGRGFSFLREGPLDMRMDVRAELTAAEIVNDWPEAELKRILRDLGEEREAGRIARAVVRARAERPLRTTTELAALVERTIGRRSGRNPATRTFQALRMAVNDEMGELRRALEGGLGLLKPGGRFVVITFESLTDRTVKSFFAAHVGREVSLQAGGSAWQGEEPRAEWILKKAVTASEREMDLNPRSRSARLRAIERK